RHLTLDRLEIPWQAIGRVGVEADLDRLVENRIGILLHALRGATIARDLAENAIKRNGSISSADHAYEKSEAGSGNRRIGALLPPGLAVRFLPLSHFLLPKDQDLHRPYEHV